MEKFGPPKKLAHAKMVSMVAVNPMGDTK